MIGLSLKLPYLNEEFFAKMKASGVEAVEISCATEDYDKLDYAAIKAAADKEGITLWSFHFPFGYYNIASLKPGRCEETVNYHSDLIRKASAIGIKRFVVHASGEPIAAEDREECMRRAKKSLAALTAVAEECGAVIADTRPLREPKERDIVINYHVAQILKLRRELLEALRQ